MFFQEILKFFDDPKYLSKHLNLSTPALPFYRTAKIQIFLTLPNFISKKIESIYWSLSICR